MWKSEKSRFLLEKISDKNLKILKISKMFEKIAKYRTFWKQKSQHRKINFFFSRKFFVIEISMNFVLSIPSSRKVTSVIFRLEIWYADILGKYSWFVDSFLNIHPRVFNRFYLYELFECIDDLHMNTLWK